ncbi:MAG: cysK 2 [Myxococcaceae bacterium]|nr:cysK 2 [Myxococcaceae bacterium]
MKIVNEAVLDRAARLCRERKVVIPTLAQMRDPSKIPAHVKQRLPKVGLWDVDPVNLFRISWKNDVQSGLFGNVNAFELPKSITQTDARIIGLVGKYFPTGAHKVGAAFGCLVPRLVTGGFDPTTQKAVWPSTGNYCRGGAFDCALLGATAVAILPEGMSRERFEWLKKIGAEVIATPGTESNVKEIYDKCWELRRTRPTDVIFNQFEEFGNPAWHYHVTGPALAEAFEQAKGPKGRLAAYVSATGSAGTIGAGDFLKKTHSGVRVVATEAQQCPTLYMNGFGDHRIEGIGDKHIPWIHNVRNTDAVAAIDDEHTIRLLRLFNEKTGRALLQKEGVAPGVLDKLPLLGISSICNLLTSIKVAKYYELGADDVVLTVFTDSAEMYGSRVEELAKSRGPYSELNAAMDLDLVRSCGTDYLRELGYRDRKALHNLKYFTWVEQQGKTSEELRALWDPAFWDERYAEAEGWDAMIDAFNARTGVAQAL